MAAAAESFHASESYNLPCFPHAMPDLARSVGAGKAAPAKKLAAVSPPDRYALLAGADHWSAAPGHPGYFTPAIDETFGRGVIPAMFARAARREQSPEASVAAAEAEMRRIFGRWSR